MRFNCSSLFLTAIILAVGLFTVGYGGPLQGDHVCTEGGGDPKQNDVDAFLDALDSKEATVEIVEEVCCEGYEEAQEGGYCVARCEPSCANNGWCAEPNTCVCAPGYTGDTCQQSTAVDETSSTPSPDEEEEDETLLPTTDNPVPEATCFVPDDPERWQPLLEECSGKGGHLAFHIPPTDQPETEPQPDWEIDPEGTEEPYVVSECPDNFLELGDDGCYHFGEQPLTWEEAEVKCRDLDGSLVALRKMKENKRLARYIMQIGPEAFYIGGNFLNATSGWNWTWVADQQPITHFEWGPGEPQPSHDELRCLVLHRTNETVVWETRPCDQTHPYICQVPAMFVKFQVRQAKKYKTECQPNYIRVGPGCYYFSNETYNWWVAMESCRIDHSGFLLSDPKSEEALDYVRMYMMEGELSAHWIGLYDLGHEGAFVWENTVQEGQITDWAQGQPDGLPGHNCVAIDPDLHYNYRWKDRNCNDELKFICEQTM